MAEVVTQGPDATVQRGTAAQQAQNAQLEAQLEIEAKKAALRGLQESNAGAPAQAPAAPEAPGAMKVIVEKDGQTIVLDNPSAEQLRQVGLTAPVREWNPMSQLNSGQVTTIALVAMLSAVAIVYLAINALKRTRSGAAPAESKEMATRMARIENAIESVAVEVERVSEAQRFTTRMLSEGAAQHVHAPDLVPADLKHRGET